MSRGSLMRQLIIGFGTVAALSAAAVAIAFATAAPYVPAGHAAGLAWSAAAIAAAILLGLAGLLWVHRTLIRPVRHATAAVRDLGAGERTLRVPVSGPAELRNLTEAINAQAEAAAQARAEAAERDRLLLVARAAVQRMREHLRAEEVMRVAREAIERDLGADEAYLHVIREGEIGPPAGAQTGWAVPADFIRQMPPEAFAIVEDLLARGESLVLQDLQGPEADWLPPQLREPLRAAGIVSELITPFGESADFYGVIVAVRMRRGHPWTRPQVEAVEWIAADLAQALRQARVHEQEDRLMGELKALDRVKSEFIATVSHELRTPLTSIAGYVELLGDEAPGPLTPDQRQMLGAVERNTARLRHLIEDLLTLSKIESGAFRTVKEPVDLAAVAIAGTTALRPQAQEKRLALTTAAGQPVLVDGDPGQLERMLLNLLSNAVKFTPSGGRVEVGVASVGGFAVLRVSDTGIGIPEAEQKNLPARFFRASNAVQRSIPGSGLGLAIVRSIVANHDGSLAVESRSGRGTIVTVRIPLSRPPPRRSVTESS